MLPRLLAVLAVAILFTNAVSAQVKCGEDLPPIDRDAESRMTAQDFIRQVAAKETAFARALGGYGYTVEASVQTLAGDAVDGEYRQVATIGFDASGPRREIADGGINTLKRIRFADRDLDALRDAFILTPANVSSGDIVYSGRQRMGDFNASLFEVVRARVDEQYWFPVLIRADETVPVGDDKVHVRVTVKYSNYKAR